MPELLKAPSGIAVPKYYGKIAGAYGNGDPGLMLQRMQRAGNNAPVPSEVSTSEARCCSFRLPFDLTVNKIRYYGLANASGNWRTALYRYSDKARLTAALAVDTSSDAWGAAGSALNVALKEGVLYFIAWSTIATTTGGVACFGDTVAATTGQIQTAPQSLPGNLDFDAGFIDGYQFGFAVTTGALPDPAPTLAAQSNWLHGMAAFFLDNSNA